VVVIFPLFFLASGFGSTYPHPYNEQRQGLFRAVVGAGLYGCKASADLFGLTKADLIDQVKDIITVGEFYDLAAGGQIIFT